MFNINNRRRPNQIRQAATTTEPTKNYLRLTNHEIHQLSEEFNLWRGVGARGLIKSEQMINTYLDFLAGGGYYRQVGRCAGVATSTAFKYTRLASEFLFDMARRYVALPRPDEFEDLSSPLVLPNGEVGLF